MDKSLISSSMPKGRPSRAPLPVERELGLWLDRSGAGSMGHDAFRKLGLLGVVWIVSGSGRYQIAGQRPQPIQRGQVLLLFPELPCRYMPDAGGWKSRWLVLGERGFSERHGLLRRERPSFPFPERRGEWIFGKLSASVPPERPLEALEHHVLLCELLQILSEAQARGGIRDPLEDLLSRLAEHPGKAWSVERLAAQSRLSPAQFRRRLRTLTGQSPKGYLTRVRMEEACRLALAGAKIPDIAECAGYHDPFFFMRAFRRHMGMTVGEYRDKHRL